MVVAKIEEFKIRRGSSPLSGKTRVVLISWRKWFSTITRYCLFMVPMRERHAPSMVIKAGASREMAVRGKL